MAAQNTARTQVVIAPFLPIVLLPSSWFPAPGRRSFRRVFSRPNARCCGLEWLVLFGKQQPGFAHLRDATERFRPPAAPNLATTEVQVWVENLGENDGVLSVFDATGRMMWQQRFGSETLTSGAASRRESTWTTAGKRACTWW
ncbi:MAG: hypothetical protein ABMA02_00660 [Saprospiraceae bacterium]